AVLLVLAGKWNLRAGYDDGNRHEVSVITKSKISGRKIDGEIRARQIRLQLFLQLTLPIFLRRVREIRRGIVTAAKVQLQIRSLLDLHRNPAETAISCRIGAVISEQVIKGRVLGQPREYRLKIIGIDERPSAGIRGQRNQGFL